MNLLSRTFPGYLNTALLVEVPAFSTADDEVIDDWFLFNLILIGIGRLLAEAGDQTAVDFLAACDNDPRGDWKTALVNQDPGRVNTATGSTVLTDQPNHATCLLISLAAAAFEQANLNGLGSRWQEVRAMFTRMLRSAERLDGVRKEATAILTEIGGRLPTGHPALEVLGVFAN